MRCMYIVYVYAMHMLFEGFPRVCGVVLFLEQGSESKFPREALIGI